MKSVRTTASIAVVLAQAAAAQTTLTWQQTKDKFAASNPTLKAAQLNIDESRAAEITAYLRPNPDLSGTLDQINPFTKQPPPNGGPNAYRPFAYTEPYGSISYLHERQHKRELRLQSQKDATAIAVSQQADQERTLLFNLRAAFVQTLQAKAQLALSIENRDYFDKEYAISQERYQAGDMAQMDLQRIHLQRVQYEQDYETSLVNLRTAKITMLMLLNARTPIDQFDVTATVQGGGHSAQAEAMRHGISRALITLDPEKRPVLKRAGFLTRDARKKERKKYGQPGARKRFQYSKR